MVRGMKSEVGGARMCTFSRRGAKPTVRQTVVVYPGNANSGPSLISEAWALVSGRGIHAVGNVAMDTVFIDIHSSTNPESPVM